MNFKTFADELMMLGFEMNPETVIIDITEAWLAILAGKYQEIEANDILPHPPFKYMFAESKRAHGAYIRATPEHWRFVNFAKRWGGVSDNTIACSDHALDYFLLEGEYCAGIHQSDHGEGIKDIYPTSGASWDSLHECFYSADYGHFEPAIRLIKRCLQVMLLYGETQFIKHSRQVERQVQRKTGKRPSPYFLLKVNPNEPRKVYEFRGNGTPRHVELREHRVRGHFRINPPDHPIPQFAGKTFWIPDHKRGDKELGEVLKGYRIVLD